MCLEYIRILFNENKNNAIYFSRHIALNKFGVKHIPQKLKSTINTTYQINILYTNNSTFSLYTSKTMIQL